MPKWIIIALLFLGVLVLLIILLSVVASIVSNQKAARELSLLLEKNQKKQKKIIQQEDLQKLPPPVQKWLERANVPGKAVTDAVYLKQKGLMRIKEDGPWMKTEAEQYFTVVEPGFIWKARVQMNPFLFFTGMDKYKEGQGQMSIKVLSLIPVVNATGPEINQGTLLRYLGEMVWFPTAALSSYINWDMVDNRSARATMSYQGVTASAIFTFDEQGDLAKVTTKRYREVNGKYSLDDWEVTVKEYREFQGIRIPNKMEVTWKLKIGDFTWYILEVTEVEYDIENVI